MKTPKIDVAQIIKDNPGCYAKIDNDWWGIMPPLPSSWGSMSSDSQEEYLINVEPLVSSDDNIVKLGDGGYGSGNCYGGDILQALAKIVGMRIESV